MRQERVEAGTRLFGRQLLLGRLAWVTLVLTLLIAYGVVELPSVMAPLTICNSGCTMSSADAAAWAAAGLSPAFGNIFPIILWGMAMPLSFVAIAAIIAWRKSNDWMALLVSLSLVGLGPYLLGGVNLELGTRAGWQLITPFLLAATVLSFTALFYLFPDGRFVPRWTASLFLGYSLLFVAGAIIDVMQILEGIPPQSGLRTFVDIAQILAAFIMFAAGIVAQVFRYLRVSHTTEREQTKWVVLGLAGPVLTLLIYIVFVANGRGAGTADVFTELISLPIMAVSALAWPGSVGIAILRYRLFDIDIIINRTLIYLPLTGIVAGIFAASISLSQRFFIALTGGTSDLAIGFATLITVAAFEPIKARIQSLVEKRFKGSPNPAVQLGAFGELVQNELGVFDPYRVARRLLNETALAFDATGGAVYLVVNGQEQLVHSLGESNIQSELSIPLEREGVRVGRLELKARRNGREYSPRDRAVLVHLAYVVAGAVGQNGSEPRQSRPPT